MEIRPATGSVPARHGQALPAIDASLCTGCGRCVAVCPPHVLSLHSRGMQKRAFLDDVPGCTGCARCFVHCPFGAIRMVRKARLPFSDPL